MAEFWETKHTMVALSDREAITCWWESTFGLNDVKNDWLEWVFGAWLPYKDYVVNDLVVHEGVLYYCTVDHSAETFDEENWESITTTWHSNIDYEVNDIVLEDGTLYICIVAHTSASVIEDDYWEDDISIWPVREGDEVLADHFEDIRKRMFLVDRPDAGYLDILRYYAKIDLSTGYFEPYNSSNWVGSWDGYETVTLKPGRVVLYESQDVQDLYVSYVEMFKSQIEAHPPVNSSGMLDAFWKLAPNPNRYHHYGRNAGRPTIGAQARWVINHHSPTAGDHGLFPYNNRVLAYEWWPRQVDPLRQRFPAQVLGVLKPRPTNVCFEKDHITQSLETKWDRTFTANSYPHTDIYPRRLTEYILSGAEPEGSDKVWQYAFDPKMCEAYQARVIAALEHTTSYLKELDQDYKDMWTWSEITRNPRTMTWSTEWDSGSHVYSVGDKVFVSGAPDVHYICYTYHVSDAGKEPGTGGGDSYWLTPVYQPNRFRGHPVYDYLYKEFWKCNSSTYELTLKNINGGHYDWWWDSVHPTAPEWLYLVRDASGDPDVEWPLPVGCWRRTWRYSMGRVSSLMYPGTGDPPEYYPDKICVTQAMYDSITTVRQVNYAVVNSPPEYELSSTQEASLAKRHDPTQVVNERVWSTFALDWEWSEYAEYEIHHDIVNDMRAALKQLDMLDAEGIDMYLFTYKHTDNVGWPGEFSTPLEAYRTGKTGAEDATPTSGGGWGIPAGSSHWINCGYETGVRYVPPVQDYYHPTEHTRAYPMLKRRFYFEVWKAVELERGMHISNILARVGYKGIPSSGGYEEDACEVGFGDKVLSAEPDATELCDYLRLDFDEAETVWEWSGGAWFLKCYFEARLLSPWPPESFFTGDVGWWRGTNIDPSGYNMDKFCVFEVDWNKIPSSVFEELVDNYLGV